MTDFVEAFLRKKYPEATDDFIAWRLERLAQMGSRAGKTCVKCGEFKALSAFGSDASRTDGLSIYCRACRRK